MAFKPMHGSMSFLPLLLLFALLGNRAGTAEAFTDESKCDCCDHYTLHAYHGELQRHCLSSSMQEQEEEGYVNGNAVSRAAVLVVGETLSGSPSVPEAALPILCASSLCRSAVLRFWTRVRGCSDSSAWKRYGFAWVAAKVSCMRLPQEAEPVDGPRYEAIMHATFHSDLALTPGAGGLEDATSVVKDALLGTLWSQPRPVRAEPEGLRVQISRAIFSPPAGQPRPFIRATPNLHTCTKTMTTWPAEGEVNVGLDLRYIVLHFDRCVRYHRRHHARLVGSGKGCMSDVGAKLHNAEERMPGRTLIFKPEKELRSGCCYKFQLQAEAVHACNDKAPLCKDVKVKFCTQRPAPVPHSELVEDRWLKVQFDMPVLLNQSSKHRFRLEAGPESQIKEEEEEAEGDEKKLLKLTEKVSAWFHLDPAPHMVWTQESGQVFSGAVGSIKDHGDGTGNSYGKRLLCKLVPDTQQTSYAHSCDDHKSFAVDMCSILGNCPHHNRLPCGMVLIAYYPPGLVLSEEGAGNIQRMDTQKTRLCKPPHLINDLRLVDSGKKLFFSWTEPAEVANPSASISLCDRNSRRCMIHGITVADPAVSPCGGGIAGCAEWSLDLRKAKRRVCGLLELRIGPGAAQAVHNGHQKSTASHAMVDRAVPCDDAGEETTPIEGIPAGSLSQECMVMYDHKFLQEGDGVYNLIHDLHSMHMSLDKVQTQNQFWNRLRAGPISTPCVIVPPLRTEFWEGNTGLLFDYVRHGGQLYVVGGRVNRNVLPAVFGLEVEHAFSGDSQHLQKHGEGKEERHCTRHWLKVLPILNSLVPVKLPAMAAERHGHTVLAQGLYSSSTSGWHKGHSFGVLEAKLEKGIVDYIAFDWHDSDVAERRPWAMTFALIAECNAARIQEHLGLLAQVDTSRSFEGRLLQEACHTVQPGEPCWTDVTWAKGTGISSHPDWYPGLTAVSSNEEFQCTIYKTDSSKCPRPCNVPCEAGDAAQQESVNFETPATIQTPIETDSAEVPVAEPPVNDIDSKEFDCEADKLDWVRAWTAQKKLACCAKGSFFSCGGDVEVSPDMNVMQEEEEEEEDKISSWAEKSSITGHAEEPDLEISISLECEYRHDRISEHEADASSCDGLRTKMMESLLVPTSSFYSSMQGNGMQLHLHHFSPPQIIEVMSECAPIEAIEDAVFNVNVACNFHEEGTYTAEYTSSTDIMRSHLVQSRLGIQLFDEKLKQEVCHRPLCRGMALRARDLLKGCPESAGHKGVIAVVVEAIHTTMDSCLEVHSPSEKGATHPEVESGNKKAVRGVWSSDISEVGEVLLAGLDSGSVPEMRALERAVVKILASELHLPALPLEEKGASFADVFDPLLGGPNIMMVSDTDLRIKAQVTPLKSAEPFDSPVAVFDEDKKDEIPISQRVEYEGVHNLHMIGLQPRWNQHDVDPSYLRIRVIFEDIVAKDDVNAVIRVFPVYMRDVCMKLLPNDPMQWQSFPFQSGRGESKPAGGSNAPLDKDEGMPVGFVCHTIAVSDDSQVLVSGEVLQIELKQPLLRNTEYAVILPPRVVQAAMGSTAFPGAKWQGWAVEEGQGDEEYTFVTGIPKASNAKLSIASSCSSEESCRHQRRMMSTRGMEELSSRAMCFVSWFRCKEDPISKAHCVRPAGMSWCDVRGNWDPSWQAPRSDLEDEKEVEEVGVPVQAVSEAEIIVLPSWVYICALAAWLQGTFGVLRTGFWVCDLYVESREFDPYTAEVSRSIPVRVGVAALVTPFIAAVCGALVAVPLYRAMSRGLWPDAHGRGEAALMDSHRLHAQIACACSFAFCACQAVMAAMVFGTVARLKDCFFDKGQIIAIVSGAFAAAGAAGAAAGWVTAAGIRSMALPWLGLSCAVFSLAMSCAIAQLATVLLMPLAVFGIFYRASGIGDILRYCVYFQAHQWQEWWTNGGGDGSWSCWVIFIKDISGVKGFCEAMRERGYGDGSLFLNFYCSSTPFNTAYTRSHTVRYSSDAMQEQKFEGEDIHVNIKDPFSLLVVDVMFQPQSGFKPELVAQASWDPWREEILDKYFHNWNLCDAKSKHQDIWNPKDLFKPNGQPHSDVFLELELNLTRSRQVPEPEYGVIRFQATHLGSLRKSKVRSNPWSPPERLLAMGDTIPGRFRQYARRPVVEVKKENYRTGHFRRDEAEEQAEIQRLAQRQQLRQRLAERARYEIPEQQRREQAQRFAQQRAMYAEPRTQSQVRPFELDQEAGETGLWTLSFGNWFGPPPPTGYRHPQMQEYTRPGAQGPRSVPNRQDPRAAQASPPGSGWLDWLGGPAPTAASVRPLNPFGPAGPPGPVGQREQGRPAGPVPPDRLQGPPNSRPQDGAGRRDLSIGGLSDWLGDPLDAIGSLVGGRGGNPGSAGNLRQPSQDRPGSR
eukprot:TRINITY_DN3422_c4_g1_i1.p1 TRINITY_DN3422_c4_g1~~TRINITY_DN3422_c4_g1_i1.p1  ORF type:complete len:2383 (+),score=448.38 TRINITY_DN3422_c4_g1_i1:66-7214(+)